jgi:signal transduction histidine kinase
VTERQETLAHAYAQALREYASGAGEAALLRGYQVGRDTLTAGLGVLELATFHQRALVDALQGLAPGEHARVARAAAELFAEALAAFEMSQRGLRGQLQEHERLERLKNEFISVVSHELRTPLTSIHGSLDLVVQGECGEVPPEARRFLEIAHRNSQRVVRLVNQILDLQKIESGELGFEVRPVALAPLLAEGIETNQTYAGRFEVRIALHGEPPAVNVRADPDRLLQVLTNLLCNAARFSPPGETVTVRAARLPGHVKVSVSDRGPGIPDEFRARVFQTFAQAATAAGRPREGSGLGLSISKAIVERLGGRIGFESEAGRGTTFHFEVPEWREGAAAPEGSRPPWPSRP